MMTLELVRLSCVNLTAYPLEFDANNVECEVAVYIMFSDDFAHNCLTPTLSYLKVIISEYVPVTVSIVSSTVDLKLSATL